MTHSSPANADPLILADKLAELPMRYHVEQGGAPYVEISDDMRVDLFSVLRATSQSTLERIAELQYEAGMYKCLYENAQQVPRPADASEMLTIAGEYEAGLQKMIACGYEEYGPEPQRKHRLIIEALRIAGQSPLIRAQCAPEPDLLAVYRDIFAEITAKAMPVCDQSSDDPERVRYYRLPVGPIHRAAGKLNFQMFDGEANLARAIKDAAQARDSAIEECARVCENGEWVGYANQHSPTKSCALAIRDLKDSAFSSPGCKP